MFNIYILIHLIGLAFTLDYLFYSSCPESAGRSCPNSNNQTDFLLSLKKGGTDVLSTNDYMPQYFNCEQYNFDCGYIQTQQQYVSIGNGIQLNMNISQFNALPIANTGLMDKIRPYVGFLGQQAKCGMSMIPLTLTSAQSIEFFDGYMINLTSDVSAKYTSQKANTSKTWADVNINIKTAVLQTLKQGQAKSQIGDPFWDNFINNNFSSMSSYLKKSYQTTSHKQELHSSYLIDSVTSRCNKYQSINFLVDESGSIGPPAFQLALDFLDVYVTNSLDQFSIMSIHFYDATFDPYIEYGNNQSTILNMIRTKPYRSLGTFTGLAINQTVNRIIAGNFLNGVPKVMVVMTDGNSNDPVLQAANHARNNGIIVISVGIGPSVNDVQLLQMAQNPSNIIKINSYADLQKLAQFIENYFCKQIITINLNQTIQGNIVRVPQSPSYFRVVKSTTPKQYYELDVEYYVNPDDVNESASQSQVDPFPDIYTEYVMSQSYRASPTKKVYFIQPVNDEVLLIKKNLTQYRNVTTSYVSFRGYNMSFNLTLKVCTTLNCTVQRLYYRSLNQTNSTNSTNSTNNTIAKTYNYSYKQQDTSIYPIIAGSLAALACCTITGVLAIKKLQSQEQQQAQQHLPQNTEDDEVSQMSRNSHSSKKSDKSNKSRKSGKSNKSDGSDKSHRKNSKK